MKRVLFIGFGFIGRYLEPCVRALGEPAPETVYAVKASGRGLEELRERFPYTFSYGDNAAALEAADPDIVILCPPPETVPAITEEVLRP